VPRPFEPEVGSEEANWGRNEKVLLKAMKSGLPIRDASVNEFGELTNNTGFLAKERDLLEAHDWHFDSLTGTWIPS
jgi:hypothetical protein